MPTVAPQRYGQLRVTREALPGVRKTAAETFRSTGAELELEKAQTARAIGELAGQGARVGLQLYEKLVTEERQRADDVAILEASNALDKRVREIRYGPDGQGGIYATKGKNAMGLPEQVDESYQSAANEIGGTLTTDRQRLRWREITLQRGEQLGTETVRWTSQQVQAYQAQELQSALENIVESAGDAATGNLEDMTHVVGSRLQEGIALINTHGAQLGIGRETLDKQIADLRSDVHTGVIENLLATNQTEAASVYFEELGEQITGEQKTRIQRALQEGTLRDQVQTKTEEILAGGGDLDAQLSRARQTLSGEVEDRVVAELKTRQAERDNARREQIERIMVDGKNTIEQTRGRWEAIPPADWARLTPGEAQSLRNYAQNVREGIPVRTIFAEQYRLKKLSVDNPQAFIQTNLNEYVDRISPADLDELANMQLALRRGDEKAAEKQLGGFLTVNNVVDETLGRYGFDPNAKPDTAEGQAVLLARNMLDRRVAEIQRATGKELPAPEVQAIFEDLLAQNIEVKATLWGTEQKPLVRLTIEDVGTHRPTITQALTMAGRPADDASIVAFDAEVRSRLGGDITGNAITRIPRTDVQQLGAALQSQGVTPTADRIVQLYIQLLAQGAIR